LLYCGLGFCNLFFECFLFLCVRLQKGFVPLFG
jgi:hypothetical protein